MAMMCDARRRASGALRPRQRVFQMYLEQDLPTGDIAYALKGIVSPASVRTYVAQAIRWAQSAGVVIRPRKEPAHPPIHRHDSHQKPLSPEHARIGARLSAHFRKYPGMGAPDIADALGFGNQQSVRSMEQGFYDFTLSELQRIAVVLEIDVTSLLQPSRSVEHPWPGVLAPRTQMSRHLQDSL